MLHSSAIVNGDSNKLLDFDKSEHPVGLQLGGNKPRVLNQAIKIASKFSYDEVNLNCGCPSSRVLAGNFGVALMRTPTVVTDCIKAMKDGSDMRVSIKHRIGIDDKRDYSFVRDFVGKVRDAGCNLFYVHSRCAMSNLSPKKNRKIPPIDMLKVRLLKRDFPDCQFVANGELDSVAKCISILDRDEHLGLPGADGVMLGRAIWKFPALLSELQKAFYPEKNIHSLRDVIESLECYYNLQKKQGMDTRRVIRGWVNLFNKQKGAKKWRIMLGKGLTPLEIYDTIFCA